METWQNYIPNPKDGWTQQRLLAGGNPRFTSNYTPGPGPASAASQVPFWDQVNQWGKKVAKEAGPKAQQFAKGVRQSPIGQSFAGFGGFGGGGGGGNFNPLGAGKFAGKAIPYLPVATNVLEGDVTGAVASGIGTFIGGRLAGAALGAKAGPWGALAGGILGEPLIKGSLNAIGDVGGNLIGFGDPSDPLSGREGFRIFGKPVSQIEKTKQRMERQNLLREQYIMPMMEEIQNNQHKRTMEMASLGMMQNMMSSTNQMMAQLYR